MNYICFPAKNLVWTGGHIEKFRLRAADNKIHDLLAQEQNGTLLHQHSAEFTTLANQSNVNNKRN